VVPIKSLSAASDFPGKNYTPRYPLCFAAFVRRGSVRTFLRHSFQASEQSLGAMGLRR